MGQVQYKVSNGMGSMMVNGFHVNEVNREEATIMARRALNIFYGAPAEWMQDMISRQHIKHIRAYRYFDVNWAGQANHTNKVLKVNFAVIDIGDKNFGYNFDTLTSVIYHEMAHFWYRYNMINPKLREFKKEVLNDKYWINFYSKRHLKKWDDDLFCNEIHSILTEYKYAPKTAYTETEHDDKSYATLQRYMTAYNKLHDLE